MGKITTPDDFNTILRDWGERYQLQREHYVGMSIDDCLELVRRIGAMRCPGFVLDEQNKGVYADLVRWVNGDPEARCLTMEGRPTKASLLKGIYIAGPTGTGKTVCLDVLNIYARTIGIQYRAGGFVKFLGWNSQRSDAICEKYAQNGDLIGFKTEGILCIQDLCSEAPETLFMGNRRNVMQTVLEARADATNLFTLVTSNQPITKLKDFYGDRVQSRANEMFNYYTLKGDDRRR